MPELALIQYGDPVSHTHGFFLVVSYVERGYLQPTLELKEVTTQVVAQSRVQV